MQDFRKLRVWHLSQDLGDHIDRATHGFPAELGNEPKSQLRNAVDSIASNIAEGCGRKTKKEKSLFFHIALGSTNEVDSRLERARRSAYVSESVHAEIQRRIIDVRKMLTALILKVENPRP